MIKETLEQIAEKYHKPYHRVKQRFITEYNTINWLYPYADKEFKIRRALHTIENQYKNTIYKK